MFGLQPWDDSENYDRISAARYAQNVTTSLLVVHGEGDRRVPIIQGEQYYRFLKKMGKTTEFLRFPCEATVSMNHATGSISTGRKRHGWENN